MHISKIKKSFIKTLVAVLLVSLLPSLGLAHHSSSEFTPTRIELEGALLQLNWRNPHPSLTFQSSSTEKLWNIQLPGTIESLSAIGITANSFEVGQSVKIAGLTSNRIENYLQGSHVLFSNGNELMLKQGLQALWTQPTAILSEAIIASVANDTLVIKEPVNLSINSNIFFILSFLIGLISLYGLKSYRTKSLLASL